MVEIDRQVFELVTMRHGLRIYREADGTKMYDLTRLNPEAITTNDWTEAKKIVENEF